MINVKKLKVNVKIIDKHKIFSAKGSYDPQRRLITVRTGLFGPKQRFLCDPEHLYQEAGSRIRYVAFVDNSVKETLELPCKRTVITNGVKTEETVMEKIQADGKTIEVHSDRPLDVEKDLALSTWIEKSTWEGWWAPFRVPLRSVIIYMLAGMGVYHLLLVILRMAGVNV